MAPAAAHTADGIQTPIDLDTIPPFYKRKNGILLYFLLTSSLFASMALGIDGVSFPAMFLRISLSRIPRPPSIEVFKDGNTLLTWCV